MKIFATADLHLGMKFSTYDDIREELYRARFTALGRCVEAANERGCDLFIVAGDLFDRQNVSGDDISAAVRLLSGFSGSAVAVLPGNHDFFTGLQGKPWGDFMREAENAAAPVVLLSETRPYELDHYDLAVTVMPGPCTKKHSAADAISWITGAVPAAAGDPERLVLGVAHGSVEGLSPDFEGDYYPMEMRKLDAAPVRFWSIGHTHRPFPEAGSVGPRLFVPGTPEPDGFNCRHAGSAQVLECAGGRLESVTAVDTGTYRFFEELVVVERAADLAAALPLSHPGGALVSLKVKGALSREEYEKIPAAIDELKAHYAYVRVDLEDLEELVSRETVDEEFTAGSFPHRLMSAFLDENDPEAAQLAYRLIAEGGT